MARIISIFIALTIMFSGSLSAQEKTRKAYRPDIPGFFLVDFGFNNGLGKPANFTQGFWGSRTLNLYYHYPVRIGNTKFTYNPGAGFSFERFKLTNNYTLAHTPDGSGFFDLVPAAGSILPNASIKKSMIVSNYFDLMPVEFRFDTNPRDVSRGFNFSIGARIGFLMETHTKVKYADNGVSGIYKDKQQHGLNPIRYGAYTRIGIGNFNWFWMYNFSPYFNTNKGPDNTSMNTMTIGISINGL
ncbi:MAG: hypothetical protein JSS79_12640 [Bacteroidetes bacterium]|nr:hypothetical protein [Bacteroidota bacterium]